ncbi:hypothetical protein [Jiangella mangrovi]|uniref:Ferritin-like domain-containing protein n=1 Tax=Jiangella mangrovi TaxID=1524084 RepID=A0A7W9GTS6_9ACTN|nr:hypothetical protein [Jiangella mangrovi]MBB5789890.1 hypothetical protein [Jiangella mangrovi]
MTQRVDDGRRRLLALVAGAPVLGAGALAALSGCAADPRPKAAPGARSSLDADVKLRWRAVASEQGLLALHAATVAAHPDLAPRLEPLTAHHESHLAALRDDGPLPFGSAADSVAATPEVPGEAGAALSAVADAERAAADACVAACLAAAGPRLAAVLASIAASEASHGVVLS